MNFAQSATSDCRFLLDLSRSIFESSWRSCCLSRCAVNARTTPAMSPAFPGQESVSARVCATSGKARPVPSTAGASASSSIAPPSWGGSICNTALAGLLNAFARGGAGLPTSRTAKMTAPRYWPVTVRAFCTCSSSVTPICQASGSCWSSHHLDSANRVACSAWSAESCGALQRLKSRMAAPGKPSGMSSSLSFPLPSQVTCAACLSAMAAARVAKLSVTSPSLSSSLAIVAYRSSLVTWV